MKLTDFIFPDQRYCMSFAEFIFKPEQFLENLFSRITTNLQNSFCNIFFPAKISSLKLKCFNLFLFFYIFISLFYCILCIEIEKDLTSFCYTTNRKFPLSIKYFTFISPAVQRCKINKVYLAFNCIFVSR